MNHENTTLDPATGKWVEAIPAAYAYAPLQWLMKRLSGWRDQYGRKALLWKPWEL